MIGRGGFVRRRYGLHGLGQNSGNVPGGSITFGGDAGSASGAPASGSPAAPGSVAPAGQSDPLGLSIVTNPGGAGPYSCTALGTDVTSMFLCAYWPFLALGAVLFIVGMRAKK